MNTKMMAFAFRVHWQAMMRDSSSADVQKLSRDRVKQKDHHDHHVGSMETLMPQKWDAWQS